MYGQVQRRKIDAEAGEFTLEVDTLTVSIVNVVVEVLKEKFADEVRGVSHLVSAKSHPEYSSLVIVPTNPSSKGHLLPRLQEVMRNTVRSELEERSYDWAS